MASPSNNGMHITLPASKRAEILHELADIASSTASSQLDAFASRLADALLHGATSKTDLEDAKLCAQAASLLKKNRYAFHFVASERLKAVLHQELGIAEDVPLGVAEQGGAIPLLSPDLEIDKKLCLMRASREVENDHTERLTALGMRLAYLFERDMLPPAENPFRPQVFLTALHEAWCEFNAKTEMHHLVFRRLGSNLCLDLGPVLHALNAALVKRGIAPKLTQAYRVDIVEDRRTPAQSIAADRPLADAFPALFQEEVVEAASTRHELLDYLTEIQKNPSAHRPSSTTAVARNAFVLDWVRKQAPHGTLTDADHEPFELLTKIFNAAFSNPHIPPEFKSLIADLQVPALKAALIDTDFFSNEAHPARRLIDRLATVSAGWDAQKGRTDPLYLIATRNIKRIQQEFERNLVVFSDALSDLDAFLKREETASVQVLAPSISKAMHQEKMALAAKAARNDVALRVGTGEVVAFVETFLEDKWVSVLTLAYSVKDDKPQAVENAVKTMDDLVWSVKPKITMVERKELLAKLPAMLTTLNKWLDLIKWDDEGRKRFFDELARCHASIVRAPLEMSPQRQVELAIDIAKKAAERRLQKRASQQPEPAPDEFTHLVSKLESGVWIEFAQKGAMSNRVKLAWISPMRCMYVFSTKERQEAMSLTADALAQAFRDKQARLVTAMGLISNALGTAPTAPSANASHGNVRPAA